MVTSIRKFDNILITNYNSNIVETIKLPLTKMNIETIKQRAEIRNQIYQRQRIDIGKPNAELKEILNKYYKEPPGWRNSIINWAKTIIPDVIKDPEGNDVEVSRTSIRNLISHGKGPLKILTLPKLPEMLCQGLMYYRESKNDKQGREEHYYNYAYPLQFEDKGWVISITVKEDYNGKRFYDNEFVQEIKSTDGAPHGTGPSTRGNLTHPSALSVLQDILSVKPGGWGFP